MNPKSKLRLLAAAFMLGLIEALVLPQKLWHKIKYRKVPLRFAANIAEGRHAASITKLTDAAITTRHLLYTVGSDADHIDVCGASDVAIGVVADEATAAEERVSVDLLGKGSTKRMVASAAIAAGAIVYSAAGGKIADSGTNVVGVALTTVTTDGDIVEVMDTVPGSTTSGVAASLFDANTILKADSDNTPEALTVAAQRIVGRITAGEITGLTGAQVLGITNPIVYDATASAADSLAIPVTHRTVQKTTGADAEALTLADGAFLGQRLHITLVADGGGDGTLTPTTPSGFATIVFADAGDTVDLEWTTDGWIISGSAGVAAPPVISV